MSTTSRIPPGRWLLSIVMAPAVWLEKARGRTRLLLIALYAAIASFAGLGAWRQWDLQSIPNYPDPFRDLPAAMTVPPQENGYSLFQQASGRLNFVLNGRDPLSLFGNPSRQLWSSAHPELQRLREDQQNALEMWKLASQRPRVFNPLAADPEQSMYPSIQFDRGHFAMLQLVELEASRLEEAGDLAGAWEWHKAAVRSIRLLGASDPSRLGMSLETWVFPQTVRPGVERWALDKRVDAKLLHKALADLAEIDALPTVDLYTVRASYEGILHRLDDPPDRVLREAEEELTDSANAVADWLKHAAPMKALRWYLKNEPARSRRVARAVYTNWRRYIEAAPAQQAKFTAHSWPITSETGKAFGILTLFDDGPGTASTAQATPGTVPPRPPRLESIAQGLGSTLLLKRLFGEGQLIATAVSQSRTNVRGLIDELRNELYLRVHGRYPVDGSAQGIRRPETQLEMEQPLQP